MVRRAPKATAYEHDILEGAFLRDVIKAAIANGWAIRFEDTEQKRQPRVFHFLNKRLVKVLDAITWFREKNKPWFALVFHEQDSRKTRSAGFPDLVLVHPRTGRLIFAELKMEDNYPSFEQRMWLAALDSVAYSNPKVEVFLWKPSDWTEIIATFGGVDIKLFA